MGLRRLVVRHGEDLVLHRRLKAKSSFGTAAAMLALAPFLSYFFNSGTSPSENRIPRHDLAGYRRLTSENRSEFEPERALVSGRRLSREADLCKKKEAKDWFDDPIIPKRGTPKAYKNAKVGEKFGILVHIIFAGYMLLGLNTVCDIYFCGALDMMVEKWKVQADVAGATFMAAGGSAPELFTSLIGAWQESDVGFGTIVGSAVFNVLAVIGACGMAAKEPITLSWWPLFRDCTYYIGGLCLLALCAMGKSVKCPDGDGIISDDSKRVGGGGIKIHEAVILFLAYICYCILMYFSDPLNKKMNACLKMFGRNPDGQEEPCTIKVTQVSPADPDGNKKNDETEPIKDLRAAAGSDGSAPGPPDHHKGCDQAPGNEKAQDNSEKDGRGSMTGEKTASGHHKIEHHIRVVHHKIHVDPVTGKSEARRTSKNGLVSPRPGDDARRPSKQSQNSKDKEEEKKDEEKGEKEEEKKDEEDGESGESDDIEGMMQRPDELHWRIVWYFSLPIYGSLYYSIPKPTEKCFIASFFIALCWIAAFSFVLVYSVEMFGKAILGGGNNVTVVMGFTVLAAGTSIPDLVSSMTVARAGEGDMAVSSSIGSNIFDILVGLPIPWIIKILLVERKLDYEISIKSPYIALYVFLLLFMVFCVIISIHFLGWKLNQALGFCMAGLYVIFLAVVLPVELGQPTALMM